MNVCVIGGTGYIGRNLVVFLHDKGYTVTVISRQDFKENLLPSKILDKDVVINLAGEPINGRWYPKKKKEIYQSRIGTTRLIVSALNELNCKVKTLITVSAVGVYDGKHIHNESSTQFANNFLAGLVLDWENELKSIKNIGIRIIILRMGLVIGKDCSLLKRLIFLSGYGLGFKVKLFKGFPFIHLKDVLNICEYVIRKNKFSGIINVVSPIRTSVNSFFEQFNKRSKAIFTVRMRIWMLKFLMGESAILITEGQDVVPSQLKNAGYQFIFPELNSALDDIFSKEIK
jgi:uncharacterized protein (TIGR01777 family)